MTVQVTENGTFGKLLVLLNPPRDEETEEDVSE